MNDVFEWFYRYHDIALLLFGFGCGIWVGWDLRGNKIRREIEEGTK